MTFLTRKCAPGMSSTSASLEKAERCWICTPRLQSMLKSVRSPLSPRNSGFFSTSPSEVQLETRHQRKVSPMG